MNLLEIFKKNIRSRKNKIAPLKVGDIIWARRYKNETAKKLIKKGHQESPFVVIKKKYNKIYVLQCTSNPHQGIKWKMMYYSLGKFEYKMNKNSYVSCYESYLLEESQFIKVMGHLTDYDLNQLKKQLYILSNSNLKLKLNVNKKDLDYKIGKGDVINLNGYSYYIFNSDDNYLYGYRLRKKLKKSNRILISNTYYSFIFEEVEMIKKNDSFSLIDTFNTGEIEIVNKYKNKYLKDKENREKAVKTLNVGAMIEYKKLNYYIYDERGNELFAYQVFNSNDIKPGMTGIKIEYGIFWTYFAQVGFNREKLYRCGLEIKRCASEDEIEYNKKMFNSNKDERKVENWKSYNLIEKENINSFVPMVVLKNENNKNLYLVINREQNVIEVVNINDIGDSYYFELEEGNCPFGYYSVLPKEEYDKYLEKIKALKEMVNDFDRVT